METKSISLEVPYEKAGIDGSGLSPRLSCMIHDSQPERRFPAIIVVPGGCYTRCSKREGEPVAARWYSYGYNAFVLDYSVVDKTFPTAMLELAAAVRFVRANRETLRCTDKVIVCGFSAGGHLAASLGVYSSHEKYAKMFGGRENIRIDKLILSYPVITSGEYSHKESCANIAPTNELMEVISLEKHMTPDFPETFIWHCADDKTVPVENSLMLAAELSRYSVPFELHIFPSGGHGIALCDTTTMKDNDPKYINPTAAQWTELALRWANTEKTQ